MIPLQRVRSVLFTPAVRPDFVARLPQRGADVIVIDCEDATPPAAKADGRRHARSSAMTLAEAGCRAMIRVNPVRSEWFADDIAEGLVPDLTAVVVPKVERLAEIDEVSSALDAAGFDHLGVLAGIETALGVADARALLAHPRVVAAYFGAEDFIADMGGVRTVSNVEVVVARSTVALAGRLAAVPTIDQVVIDIRNADRFIAESAEARAMGFAGKLCIHPDQVALANAAFSPSADEVARAHRLLAAYDLASRAGRAAIDFEGQMVDEPVAVQARRIIELATDSATTNEGAGK